MAHNSREPTRTLLVSNDFPPQLGGIQRYADQIARRLPGACVFAAAHPEAQSFDDAAPYRVRRGPSRFMLPTPSIQRALHAAAAEFDAQALLFMAPFPLAPLGVRAGLPWAVCTHGAELIAPSRLPGVAAAYRRWLSRADRLFSVSSHTARHLRRLVGPAGPPIGVLRSGVALDTFNPDADGTAVRARHRLGNAPVITCVGRLVARKGQDALVAAVPLIREQIPDARLLLVGDGPLRARLRRAARKLPPGAVVFAGKIAPADLPAYYAAGDIFASPNRSRWLGLEEEGFGIVFLEAQACARPVVAGRSGGAPETLREHETGLLVDPTSSHEIADAVIDLLADRRRRLAMGQAARVFVEANFDWTDIIRRLATDLEQMTRHEPVKAR